jgi:transposase
VTKTKRKRRIFTPEFKRQAVALYETSGRKLAAVAAEIDVHETVLRHWISQFGAGAAVSPAASGPAPSAGPSFADQAAEIAQLRRENERLRMERDILKKAALILGDQKR